MSDDFEIHGANDFYRLSKALKRSRPEMRRQLNAGVKRAAKPLRKVAKDAAAEVFPKRGGLSAREAKIPFKAVTRTGSPDTAGVRIQAPGNYVAAKTTNATGVFRKPVYGRYQPPLTIAENRKRWHWEDQEIPGATGWFDKAMEDSAPLVRPEIEKAIDAVVDTIVREGFRA